MSGSLTLAEIAEKIAAQQDEVWNAVVTDWSLLEWGGALAGEVGELCNEFKKQRRGDQAVFHDDVMYELGDILIYLTIISNRVGIPLDEAIRASSAKVALRTGAKDPFA